MAEKGDSKNGLIITVVCLVLVCLGLGVATYYGFAGQRQASDQAADAKKKEETARKSLEWEQFQNLMLKAHAGAPLSKDDRDNLITLVGKYESGQLGKEEKDHEAFDLLHKTLSERLRWDAVKKMPRDSLLGKVESLEGDNRNLSDRLAKTQDLLNKTRKELNDQLAALQTERDELAKSLAGAKKELADALNTKSAEFIKLQNLITDRDNQLDDISRKKQEGEDLARRKNEKQDKRFSELKNVYERIKGQLPQETVLDYDLARGALVRIDRRGQTAYIDLGSADGVKPRLKFSVFPVSETRKAEGQRKGSLEVISVLKPHLSVCRVTDIRDNLQNPIMPGDLIFNPAWSPSLKQHVAIGGYVDLTGQGRNDLAEFMRTLKDMGIVVDAWLDIDDMNIKGPGITRDTNFLVVGPEPELGFTVEDLGTKQGKRKQELMSKTSEMQTEANANGVPVVPLRRFLGMIGYRLPRGAETSNTFRDLPGGLKYTPQDEKAPTDKDMKKDEPKEPDK